MKVPSQRLVNIISIALIAATLVMCLLIGLAMGASPRELGLITLIALGASGAGVLIGRVALKFIYSDLERDYARPSTCEHVPAMPREVAPVEYELDREDILSFFFFKHEQSPRRRMTRKLIGRATALAVAAELLASAIVLVGLESKYRTVAMPLVGVAVLTSISYFVYPLVTRKAVKAVVKRDYGHGGDKLAGKHRLSLGPQEVIDVSAGGKSTTPWSSVEWIGSTGQHLFIMVRESGPYILPKRALPDEEMFRQAVAAAKLYRQQAQGA